MLVERHVRQPTKPRVADHSFATAIGVDRRGAIAAACDSARETLKRDFVTLGPKEAERLRRLEQARERQKNARGRENRKRKSRRQERNERAIAAVHARKRRRSKDFIEQTSNDLAKNHGLVVFEKLRTRSMTATAHGTLEHPGKNVAAKAGMNRSFLSKAPAALLERTSYKAALHGHQVIEVPAKDTSITCSAPGCRHVDPGSRHGRSFCCALCGHEEDADTNAAKNIRERGIKLALAGRTPVAASQGTNLGSRSEIPCREAEPELLGRHGSGNQEMDPIADRDVALAILVCSISAAEV